MLPGHLSSRYDHPYFGQLFLAGALGIVGYPDLLNPRISDIYSIEMLHLLPRLLMGILAVFDTFLIYKIAERRYSNRNIAFIGSNFIRSHANGLANQKNTT